ncbi:hypothetical protein TIFTF001_012933 [Ficus carica]|uniref:Uncharacterized protein n=1 Tax=Ficus carica TaxID=3494 RepID=A0AA88DI61_FICCA|nr:hypothetical protein TIFTF001_012933 [Ficus carica]
MIMMLLKPILVQASRVTPIVVAPAMSPTPLPPCDLRPPTLFLDGFKINGLPFKNMEELGLYAQFGILPSREMPETEEKSTRV